MKSKIILKVVVLLTIAFTCPAQTISHKEIVNKDTLEEVKTFTGELTGWAVNSDYIYGGFYLQVACTKYLVVFSPNMGKKLRRKIKANTILSIEGYEVLLASNEKVIKLISFKDEFGNIYHVQTAAIAKERIGRSMKGNGKINELQKDIHDKDEGFVLDNQIILRMPQANLEEMKKIALVGTHVSYNGKKQRLPKGEVVLMDYTVIFCNSVIIDGKEYLTR